MAFVQATQQMFIP